MNKYVVYFDRLPYEKIEELRATIGAGELNWRGAFPALPQRKKAEVGRIAFGCDVKKVTMQFERNVSNGFDVPIIIAEAV